VVPEEHGAFGGPPYLQVCEIFQEIWGTAPTLLLDPGCSGSRLSSGKSIRRFGARGHQRLPFVGTPCPTHAPRMFQQLCGLVSVRVEGNLEALPALRTDVIPSAGFRRRSLVTRGSSTKQQQERQEHDEAQQPQRLPSALRRRHRFKLSRQKTLTTNKNLKAEAAICLGSESLRPSMWTTVDRRRIGQIPRLAQNCMRMLHAFNLQTFYSQSSIYRRFERILGSARLQEQ